MKRLSKGRQTDYFDERPYPNTIFIYFLQKLKEPRIYFFIHLEAASNEILFNL